MGVARQSHFLQECAIAICMTTLVNFFKNEHWKKLIDVKKLLWGPTGGRGP
jgi:hypothetical protein